MRSSFDRFDANVSPHYHFVCHQCSSIYDLPLPLLADLEEQVRHSTNHKIETHEIKFYGTCETCSA